MNRRMIAAALVAATLGTATSANAQAWGGPPPPPPPYGYAPPPPPPPPPAPPYVAGRAYWSGYGYAPRHHHRHCWTEYRHGGWERVKICE